MGFWSVTCQRCGRPVLSGQADESAGGWMRHVVAVDEAGERLTGTYDGYGSLIDADGSASGRLTSAEAVWHEACWETAGQPSRWEHASPLAPDQGWFFDPGTYALPDPRVDPGPTAAPPSGTAADTAFAATVESLRTAAQVAESGPVRCGAPRVDGSGPCQRLVGEAGQRCPDHR